MNARPNPYALTFSDLTRTLVRAVEPSMKERLQAMADQPLTGPRFPSKPPACRTCKGIGGVREGSHDDGYHTIQCPDCDGTGERDGEPSADVLEARSQLRDRLDAELAQDEPNGWNDASEQYEEMPE